MTRNCNFSSAFDHEIAKLTSLLCFTVSFGLSHTYFGDQILQGAISSQHYFYIQTLREPDIVTLKNEEGTPLRL